MSREVARHGSRPQYRASEADSEACESALRPKPCLLAIHGKLQKIVASKLILDWSPEQISGWLKIQYPEDESMRESHETIHRSLFIQARGVLKKELIGHLLSSCFSIACFVFCCPCMACSSCQASIRLIAMASTSPRTPSCSGNVSKVEPQWSVPLRFLLTFTSVSVDAFSCSFLPALSHRLVSSASS